MIDFFANLTAHNGLNFGLYAAAFLTIATAVTGVALAILHKMGWM